MRNLALSASLSLVLAAVAGQKGDAPADDKQTISFQQGVDG